MAWDGSLWMKPVEQRAKILISRFESGDTDAGIRFTLGGLYKEGLFYRYVSENAYQRIHLISPERILADRVVEFRFGKGFKVEHVIPIDFVRKELSKRRDRLIEKYVKNLIERRLCCAIITDEEDKALDRCHLKSRMPEGWDFETGNVFARYEVAGISLHQWRL